MLAVHSIQQTRPQSQSARRRGVALLCLLAYLVAGGIVPQGHMAAPLSSGTAFHLCPGDLRSAIIIDALQAQAAGHPYHHHHDHGDAGGISKTSADPGCIFAGIGALAANAVSIAASSISTAVLPVLAAAVRPVLPSKWLRPPVRSPPH